MRTPRARRVVRRASLLALLAAAVACAAGCGAGAGSPPLPAKPAAPAPVAPTSGGAPATAAAVPVAAASSAPAALAPLSPPEAVKVGTSTGVTAAPLFIGLDRGYFRELGLDVEAIPFNSAAEMFQPMAASQIDVGSADIGAGIFNALARGLPMCFVADKSDEPPS
jgi:hypothetical protein